MPAQTRTRPEPAGEPSPTTIDPPPTPVEDLPAPEQPSTPPEDLIPGVFAGAPLVFGDRSEHGPDDEPLRDDYPLTVWEAIAEVTRRIGAVEKGRTASQGGSYRYRGIDDVLSALHPILGDVGLVLLPGQIVREAWETRSTAAGGTLNVARLLVEYVLVGPDGSHMTGQAWGEGGDAGDKATQKAASQAYKTFTFQTFSIPTEESVRDEPDATNPPARPFTAEENARATTALGAAREAASLEALVSVGRRAAAGGLLDVPVFGADGSIAPLRLHLDALRVALESRVPDGRSS